MYELGIIRTHGEADGLRQEPTRNQEVFISQDFLGPHTNTPIMFMHPLPPSVV